MDYADGDLHAAKVQFEHGHKLGSSFQIATFHCHQAVEKMLKAALAEQGKETLKIHNLVRLAVLTELKFPVQLQHFIEDLNPHYLPLRYPDFAFAPTFSFTYNRKNVIVIIRQTKKLFVWLKNKLN